MVDPDHSPTLPDPEAFQQFVLDFACRDVDATAAGLKEFLCTYFCALASDSIPVERALASVNVEIERTLARCPSAPKDRTNALRRLVMACCLDCYYPPEPERGAERVSA